MRPRLRHLHPRHEPAQLLWTSLRCLPLLQCHPLLLLRAFRVALRGRGCIERVIYGGCERQHREKLRCDCVSNGLKHSGPTLGPLPSFGTGNFIYNIPVHLKSQHKEVPLYSKETAFGVKARTRTRELRIQDVSSIGL